MASSSVPDKPKGPMPTGRRWVAPRRDGDSPSTALVGGLPVPFFFHEDSATAFREMPVKESDVVLTSMVKAGTTWVHQILYQLLHLDEPEDIESESQGQIGASSQIYPEALPLQAIEPGNEDESALSGMEKTRRSFFGTWSLQDLLDQSEPRLLSTHLFGEEYLPRELIGGRGRLVVVVRNLKDVLTSLHFFRGEAKDGWLGNEHGPGSLERFLHPDCPNAYGSVFRIMRDNQKLVDRMQREAATAGARPRVLVVYFERLKLGLRAEVKRIAEFLDTGRLSLTEERLDRLCERLSFGGMKSRAEQDGPESSVMIKAGILRKGEIGDWKNHLTSDHWEKFDEVFQRELKMSVDISTDSDAASSAELIPIARPLVEFQKY